VLDVHLIRDIRLRRPRAFGERRVRPTRKAAC
jgi:hypothetical protein